MFFTYLDSNSWLIEIADIKILLDPWLVGDLIFANAPWFFRGQKKKHHPIPEQIDLILLSQGLEDHAHPPTLKVLDKNIPVVASPNASLVVEKLGYKNIHVLKHGESYSLADKVEITAVPGSPIGPTLVENGYLIKDKTSDRTIYYEPHGFHSPTIKDLAPVDILMIPIISLKLPLLGSFIQGQDKALEVCKWLKPKVVLPTTAGGDIEFSGILNKILRAEGTPENFQALLAQNNLSTKIIEVKSGERVAV